MRLSSGMKVGLVSLFSCLALWLGLLSPMGMALAHTVNTLWSAHISLMSDTDPKPRTNGEHEGVDPPSSVTFPFGSTNSGNTIIYGHDRADHGRR
jgi:hypothetical protein